jgi:hypothetical protein
MAKVLNNHRYLGPYEKYVPEHEFDSFYGREDFTFIRPFLFFEGGFMVWLSDSEVPPKWHHVFCSQKRFASKEEAIADLDRSLIEQGYVFLTEEQYEKLRVLV